MQKLQKISVNSRAMGFYGFNDSSFSVITLSVSKTDVKLPLLNISYTNMIVLDTSFNGIANIDDIGHETFPSLKLLNLSHNALTSVKSHLFAHIKEVEILDLSYNCFVKFHTDHILHRHESLKKLYLNNNRLHTVKFIDTIAPLRLDFSTFPTMRLANLPTLGSKFVNLSSTITR